MVVGQLVVEMVMLGGVFKEGLARASMKRDEVLVKVMRQLDGLVILKGFVEDLARIFSKARPFSMSSMGKFSKSLQAVPVKEPMTLGKV